MGFDILLVGRKLKNSRPLFPRSYETKRLSLFFSKGPLFYAEFNIRLYLLLLFSEAKVLLANDLDTLPANYMASKVKRIPLVYDSHEYFTEVPELVHRPQVKRTWEWLEQKMVPGLKYATTVCDSIAEIYLKKYGTPFQVVRNLPLASGQKPEKTEAIKNEKTILYQGAVNIGRGLQQVIQAMHYIENAKLIIAGDGDIKTQLETFVKAKNLENKIEFTGRLTIEELTKLTPIADLGLSVEDDFGLNYRYALPNKLFDYIQAQVPVLVSNLPEMAAIVNRFNVGTIAKSLDPVALAATITDALENADKRRIWLKNLRKAADELTWENEEVIIHEIFQQFQVKKTRGTGQG
jgi:glycosyltransferase involved in cell wall biosynthesis